MNANSNPARSVSMIVWNDMRNDARVRREAKTLGEMGCRVVVFALHTPGVTQKNETISENVTIKRVLRSPFWHLKRKSTSSDANKAQKESGHRGASSRSKSRFLEKLKLFAKMGSRLITQARLLGVIIKAKSDVIHAHDINVLHIGWLASKFTGSKLIYDAHEISTSREGYRSIRGAVYVVERFLIKRADKVFATTELRSKYLSRVYKIPRPTPLYNKPDLSSFNVGKKADKLRDELTLKQPWPIVLYQGGIQAGRGLERLVLVAKNIPHAYFVFLGSGRLVGELKALADRLDLSHRVLFVPAVEASALADYTQSADIGVQPIENTCFNHFTTDSNKLFEYACAGVPVVASDLPEIKRVVETFEIGEVYNHRCLRSLEYTLTKLINDESLRKKYSRNGTTNAVKLSWQTEAEKLVRCYEKLSK